MGTSSCMCCLTWLVVMVTASWSQTLRPEASPLTDIQESCRLRRIIYRIDYEGCIPRRLLSFACQGRCHSYSQVSGGEGIRLERQCSCCQEVGKISRNVTLRCLNVDNGRGRPFRNVVMRIMLPTGCMCRPCSAGVGIEPLELAGIGDKRTLWDTFRNK